MFTCWSVNAQIFHQFGHSTALTSFDQTQTSFYHHRPAKLVFRGIFARLLLFFSNILIKSVIGLSTIRFIYPSYDDLKRSISIIMCLVITVTSHNWSEYKTNISELFYLLVVFLWSSCLSCLLIASELILFVSLNMICISSKYRYIFKHLKRFALTLRVKFYFSFNLFYVYIQAHKRI